MAGRQRQRHVPAVGTAHDGGALRIDPLILGQTLHRVNVIQAILSAPIAVNPFHIIQAIAAAAAYVGHEYRETVQRQILDERHRKPCEVRALLTLWTAMYVIDQRARPLEAERLRREI